MVRVPQGVAPGLPQGTQAGSVCLQPVNLLDLFPTLTELAGLPRKKDNDGRSLVPLLRKPDDTWKHGSITYLAERGGYSVSVRDWRYIHYPGGDEELYHIAEDPYEWTNLATEPAHEAQLAELRRLAPMSLAEKPEPTDDALPLLAWHPLNAGDAAPASRPDGTPFDVVFLNHSKQAVELHWVDRDGGFKPYGILEPGGRMPQQTRPGAVWAVCTSSGTPVGYFAVGDRKARAVVP